MTAGRHTLNIEQGTYWSISLVYKDPQKVPYDLTGYSARLQFSPYVGALDGLLALTTEDGDITLGTTDGTILVEASGEQTALLSQDSVYELELIAPNGEAERILRGRVILGCEVV
jgi:hypothetical protein